MLAAAVKTRQKGKNYRFSIKVQWVPSHLGLWSPSGTPSGYWSPIFQDLKFLFFFFCNVQGRKNEFKVRDFDNGPIGFNWLKFCFHFDKWFHSDCCQPCFILKPAECFLSTYFPVIDFSREQKVILHLMTSILYTVLKKLWPLLETVICSSDIRMSVSSRLTHPMSS